MDTNGFAQSTVSLRPPAEFYASDIPTLFPQQDASLLQAHPNEDEAATDVDIITVHVGRDMKPPKTWAWQSSAPSNSANWRVYPQMLSDKVGMARIFTCNYLLDQDQGSIEELARLLLACIQRRPLLRDNEEEENRPILFIASSLGGVVLAKALVIADQQKLSISRATRGIVFLATPFEQASFQEVSRLHGIEGSTYDLAELVVEFTRLCQVCSYSVQSFCELKKTNERRGMIPWVLDWLYYKPPFVDSSSVALDVASTPLPLSRPHILMNELCDRDCSDCVCITEGIQRILQKIRREILLAQVDSWILDKHYTMDRLRAERLSGDNLSIDRCDINLEASEWRGLNEGRTKTSVELPTLFDPREVSEGYTIRPRRIHIYGNPGVGKTTLCKKIVYKFGYGCMWVDLFDRILWVPLRSLKGLSAMGYKYSLRDLLYYQYFHTHTDGGRLTEELVQTLKDTHGSRTLFILDGLDEVSQDLTNHSDVFYLIQDLLSQPNIIITSRPYVNLPASLGLDIELEIVGFQPGQISEFLDRVLPRRANEIQTFLRYHWPITELIEFPIQLDALCFTWESLDSVSKPRTLTRIYAAMEQSLWRKDVLRLEKQVAIQSGSSDLSEIKTLVTGEAYLLEGLAFAGLYNNILDFTPNHRYSIFKQFGPSEVSSVDEILSRVSFLRRSSPTSEDLNGNYRFNYSFLHQTYQDYFAALYFMRQWGQGASLKCVSLVGDIVAIEPAAFLQMHKDTPHYVAVWRFVAGLSDASGNVEAFFNMIEKPHEPPNFMHQRLIMYCSKEVSQMPLRKNLEDNLVQSLLSDSKFAIGAIESEEFTELVEHSLLRQACDEVKRKILGLLEKRPKIPPDILRIETWLGNDASGDLKISVCNMLWNSCEFLPEHSTLRVIATWLEDEDWRVRDAALRFLGTHSTLPEDLVIAAFEALSKRKALPEKVLKDVAAQLKGKQPGVREATENALSHQPNPLERMFRNVAAQSSAGLKSWETKVAVPVTEEYRSHATRQVLEEAPVETHEDMTSNIASASNGGLHRWRSFGNSGYNKAIHKEMPAGVQPDNPIGGEANFPNDEGTDCDSCSDISSITSSGRDYYASRIANGLIGKLFYGNTRRLPCPSRDEQEMDKIARKTNNLLKAFALKIGHDSYNGKEAWISRYFMVFIYKYRERITELLMNGFRRAGDSSQSEPVSDMKDISGTGGDASLGMAPLDKVDDWLTQMANAPPEYANGNANTYLNPAANGGSSEDSDTRAACNEYSTSKALSNAPNEELSMRPSRTHDIAYDWLLSRLKRDLDLAPLEPSVMMKISETIISSLPAQRVSRKNSPKNYRIVFEIDWSPQAFTQEQGYKGNPEDVIMLALTVTGSTNDAQVLTCPQYLNQTWPSNGTQILQLMQDVVRVGVGNQDLPDNTTLVAWTWGPRLIVEASGTRYSLAEIGEQLAWLGAALRSPPEKVAVIYCRPEIVPINTNMSISSAWDRYYILNFKFHSEAESLSPSNGHCWLKLFTDPVVVQGYPILTRSEHNTGLEIPLNTAADLIGARFSTAIDGRIFVKGFCAMLTLVRHAGDVFIWHLVATEDKSHISYFDHGLLYPPPYDAENIDILGLQSARNVIGWCQDAKSFVGEADANYYPDESLLNKVYDGFKVGSALSNGRFPMTNGSTELGFKLSGPLWEYTDRLNWLQNDKWVVLYDVKDSRGWFVDGASALLHLVRMSLEYEKSVSTQQHHYKFEISEYENAPNRNKHRALNILENNANRKQRLFENSAETFEKRVDDICFTLEVVLANHLISNKSETTRGQGW